MKDYVLEQQIVAPVVRKETGAVKAGEAGYACRCRHLDAFLPHLLDLDCVQSSPNSSSWIVANPVHALHLSSLLQPDGRTILLPKGHLAHMQPCLFGDEQRRTDAILSQGIASAFCPLPQPGGSLDRYTITEIMPVEKEESEFGADEEKDAEASAVLDETGDKLPAEISSSPAAAGAEPNTTPADTVPPTAVVYASEAERVGDTQPSVSGEFTGPPQLLQSGSLAVEPIVPGTERAVPVGSKHSKASLETDPGPDSTNAVIVSTPEGAPSSVLPEQMATATLEPAEVISSQATSPLQHLLSDDRYQELRRMEELILEQRRSVIVTRKDKRSTPPTKKRKKEATKGKIDTSLGIAQVLPGSYLKSIGNTRSLGQARQKVVVRVCDQLWEEDAKRVRSRVEEWMERFRHSRNSYWDHRHDGDRTKTRSLNSAFGSLEYRRSLPRRSRCVGVNRTGAQCRHAGDNILQCLDCPFVGCGPVDCCPGSSNHSIHHMIETGHSFAVSCGERAEIYCFDCGDYVFHPAFDEERERIDTSRRFPWMGWAVQPVQRSFDALRFATTSDHGVVWRGVFASYPSLVPEEYATAARMTVLRSRLFRGDLLNRSLTSGPRALDLVLHQQASGPNSWKICAPIGAYNLGNTCFMSCIVNVLVHCVPFQRHFLLEVRHHHKSCQSLRRYVAKQRLRCAAAIPTPTQNVGFLDRSKSAQNSSEICLACEMDVIFLDYFGSSIGKDVRAAVCEPPKSTDLRHSMRPSPLNIDQKDLRGEPIILSNLLSAVWRTVGMGHLAGYEQRDAHEFLQAFLDTLGKHCRKYQRHIREIRRRASSSEAEESTNRALLNSEHHDVVADIFEGTLRSVLICGQCGCKRSLSEPFLNISLPLAKQMEGSPRSSGLSVQRCLKHFASPEALADPVDCLSCHKKTTTQKQHTFAKLPKVLCIHLKRFDAAKNRKITDFVSFPEHGLDMGPLLPHWCEVEEGTALNPSNNSAPELLYDLFGTVNHTGTMMQGHYTSNVKVEGQWYHCNDTHVSRASNDGSVGEDVLKCDGAYILFFIRRQ